MPHEIYDAGEAILNNAIAPLFTYKLGQLQFDIYPSSAIEGKYSFNYVKAQFYSAAIATEYEDLRKQAEAIVDRSNESTGIKRKDAEEYICLLAEMKEKEVELNNWTCSYLEALALMEKDSLAPLLEAEVKRLNDETKRSISLQTVVNNLYAKVNNAIKDITVESEEEKEQALYNQGGEEGKESHPESDTPPTANGSSIAAASSEENLNLVATNA